MSTKGFFDGYSADFDSIYGDGVFDVNRGLFDRVTDKLFRGAMRARFDYVGKAIGSLGNESSILDVGCGGGVYLHFLASTGSNVSYSGFDFSPNMISLAASRAKALGMSDRVTLGVSSLEDFETSERYSLVIAMGFFDYMIDAKTSLRRLVNLSCDRVIFSVPKKQHWLAAQRKIRYTMRNCELYLYSETALVDLTKEYDTTIIDVGRDWVVDLVI